MKAEAIKRVVVRGTNWVGDTVMTLPALRELRRLLPNAHITVVTRAGTAGLLSDVDFIDALMLDESSGLLAVGSQIRKWKQGNFDLAVLFPNSFQAALIPFLARVPSRLGYEADRRGFLLTHRLPQPEWRNSRHETFYYLNIVSALDQLINGASQIIERVPDTSIQVSTERLDAASDALRKMGIRDGHPIVALCPGSINSRAKRWPAERYAALADRLIEELDADVLLIGSAAEHDVSVEVAARMRRQPIIATGATDLSGAVAMLSLVDLLITNDTGPAHIASALGRPTLVIFGPTNPLTTRPLSSAGEIIRHPPVCAPCMLRDCPIDHRCMTAVSPDEVFARAAGMLRIETTAKNEDTPDEQPIAQELIHPAKQTPDKLKFAGHPR
ncbi:MAG: lipopolysaccharide heptosyltransferase II [Pyrinomonadaceae bacterium]